MGEPGWYHDRSSFRDLAGKMGLRARARRLGCISRPRPGVPQRRPCRGLFSWSESSELFEPSEDSTATARPRSCDFCGAPFRPGPGVALLRREVQMTRITTPIITIRIHPIMMNNLVLYSPETMLLDDAAVDDAAGRRGNSSAPHTTVKDRPHLVYSKFRSQ